MNQSAFVCSLCFLIISQLNIQTCTGNTLDHIMLYYTYIFIMWWWYSYSSRRTQPHCMWHWMEQAVAGATGRPQTHKDGFQVTHHREQQQTIDPRGNENVQSTGTSTEPTYKAADGELFTLEKLHLNDYHRFDESWPACVWIWILFAASEMMNYMNELIHSSVPPLDYFFQQCHDVHVNLYVVLSIYIRTRNTRSRFLAAQPWSGIQRKMSRRVFLICLSRLIVCTSFLVAF